MAASREEIVTYYETCEKDYRRYWDLDHSMAMHAGYWDNSTKTLREALVRQNEVLAEQAQIQPGDVVLDAGCGVGGSSIFLAKEYGCDVTGITLSTQQVTQAQYYAGEVVPENRPKFLVMDFTATSFPNASFDVVWGIESVCHAQDKGAFIREAFRLLKPRGRLIVADGFHKQGVSYSRGMKKWLKGWGVETLATEQEFTHELSEAGFASVSFTDITPHVLPSSKRLSWLAIPATALATVGRWFGLCTEEQKENRISAWYQYQTLKAGEWSYGIFSAQKP